MKPAFHKFEPHFMRHKGKKDIEVEFRLGRSGNGRFDTNVGEANFNKLKRALEKYKGWENVAVTKYESYYGQNNLRTTRYEDESQISILKKSVEKVDFSCKELPFDIRMGISNESPCDPGDEAEYEMVKYKTRTSFLRKGLSIDLTVTSGDMDDKDSENESEYQVEFEIVSPKGVKNRDQFYNHIHKIKDLLKCL